MAGRRVEGWKAAAAAAAGLAVAGLSALIPAAAAKPKPGAPQPRLRSFTLVYRCVDQSGREVANLNLTVDGGYVFPEQHPYTMSTGSSMLFRFDGRPPVLSIEVPSSDSAGAFTFSHWVVKGGFVDDPRSSRALLTAMESRVELTAVYRYAGGKAPCVDLHFKLLLDGSPCVDPEAYIGFGGYEYGHCSEVTVHLPPSPEGAWYGVYAHPPRGARFKEWSGVNVEFEDPSSNPTRVRFTGWGNYPSCAEAEIAAHLTKEEAPPQPPPPPQPRVVKITVYTRMVGGSKAPKECFVEIAGVRLRDGESNEWVVPELPYTFTGMWAGYPSWVEFDHWEVSGGEVKDKYSDETDLTVREKDVVVVAYYRWASEQA